MREYSTPLTVDVPTTGNLTDDVVANARDHGDAVVLSRRDGSGWTGVAADSFVDAWDDWKLAATDVLDGLVAMAELLDAAHADYVSQDAGSQRTLDQISSRIIERLG